jgi:hypothetical protein
MFWILYAFGLDMFTQHPWVLPNTCKVVAIMIVVFVWFEKLELCNINLHKIVSHCLTMGYVDGWKDICTIVWRIFIYLLIIFPITNFDTWWFPKWTHLECSLMAFWAWDPSHHLCKVLGFVIEGLIKIGLKIEVD